MPTTIPWRRLAAALLTAAAAFLALRYLLPLLLPFLLGLAIALAAERPVATLTRRGLRRGLASVLCVGTLLALTAAALWLLLRRGVYELQALARELPELLASLASPLQRLRDWLDALTERAPEGFREPLRSYVDALFAGAPSQLGRASASAIGWASELAAKLPGALLWLGTALLSGFFLSAELPELRRWLGKSLPPKAKTAASKAARRVKFALGGWVKAQIRLTGVTFAIVTLGLLLVGIDYALLLGAVIALVDALPLFGSGAVLLPWSLLFFLRGNARCGFALIGIYAAAALTRTVLEPRLLGKQMGLSPLLALLSVYLGGRLFGLLGMILAPVGAMVALQLRRPLPSGN